MIKIYDINVANSNSDCKSRSDKPDKMNLTLHRKYIEINGIKPFPKASLNCEQQ